eukprot:6737012-Ditylum_brightwellii.AAC.2
MRSTFYNTQDNSNNNNNNSQQQSASLPKQQQQKCVKFIRQITVVSGRGFYTYCSHAPAPFLRIEYYNPSMRWKIKLLLERGLELPMEYHPLSTQYDYHHPRETTANSSSSKLASATGRQVEGEDEEKNDDSIHTKPLIFRCYEAHIPYTMQVFKDYNLSGMRHVKLSDGRFRLPLPKSLRNKHHHHSRRKRNEKKDDDGTVEEQNEKHGDYQSSSSSPPYFLESNVPQEFQ